MCIIMSTGNSTVHLLTASKVGRKYPDSSVSSAPYISKSTQKGTDWKRCDLWKLFRTAATWPNFVLISSHHLVDGHSPRFICVPFVSTS